MSLRPSRKSSSMFSICVPALRRCELHHAVKVCGDTAGGAGRRRRRGESELRWPRPRLPPLPRTLRSGVILRNKQKRGQKPQPRGPGAAFPPPETPGGVGFAWAQPSEEEEGRPGGLASAGRGFSAPSPPPRDGGSKNSPALGHDTGSRWQSADGADSCAAAAAVALPPPGVVNGSVEGAAGSRGRPGASGTRWPQLGFGQCRGGGPGPPPPTAAGCRGG